MINNKFLIYAVSLHLFVGSIALIADLTTDEKEVDKKVKISVDLNRKKEILNSSIESEAFTEEEVSNEIKRMQSQSVNDSQNEKKVKEEIAEYKRELRALNKRKSEEKEKIKKELNSLKEEQEKRIKSSEDEIKKQQKLKEDNKKLEEEFKKLQKEIENLKKKEKKPIKQDNNKTVKKQTIKEPITNKTVKKQTKEDFLKTTKGQQELINYFDSVYSRITNNWVQPHHIKNGEKCVVHITQNKKGIVQNISYITCPNDKEYREEIKKAIYKSSPLPLPKNNFLYDSKIEIIFE